MKLGIFICRPNLWRINHGYWLSPESFRDDGFTNIEQISGVKKVGKWIIAKGKSIKLALKVMCNKLLKQSFAIAKSGLIYDENYRSKIPTLS